MIVGIHQPNYLPYLGFFDKLRKSDVFVIYADAQFNKGDFQHRNRIRIFDIERSSGFNWIPANRSSNNFYIPYLATLENFLSSKYLPSISPWVIISARKNVNIEGSLNN